MINRFQPRDKKESCVQCGRSKKYLFYPIDSDDRNSAICSLCLETEQEKEREEELKIPNLSEAFMRVNLLAEENEDLAAILEFILERLPEEDEK